MDNAQLKELQAGRKTQGERLLLLLQSIAPPEQALETASPVLESPLKIGTVVLTRRNGNLRYAIASSRTKDGNGVVFTFFATSYRKKFEAYPNTFWWKELRVVSSEIVARAAATEAHYKKVQPVLALPKESSEALAEKVFAESLPKPAATPAEVRHIAALPQSLVADMAVIRGKMDSLSESQAQLWADYIEHAERVEKAVSENTAAIKELVAAIRAIPCDNKGRA